MNNWSGQPPVQSSGAPYPGPGYPTGGIASMPMPDYERSQFNSATGGLPQGAFPGQQQPYPPHVGYPPAGGAPHPSAPAQNPSYPTQPYAGNQSWPAYPFQVPQNPAGYPGQPSQATGYPSQPPTAPGYPAQPPHAPGYPAYSASQTSGYSVSQQPSYPAQPSGPSAPYSPQQAAYGNIPAGYPAVTRPGGPSYPGSLPTPGAFVTVTCPPDEPTIRTQGLYNAEVDCKVLKKAMKGLGTDEKAIIEVLTNRPLAHRLQLTVAYKSMYGKDLISHLKSELSGNLENTVVAMLQPAEVYDARTLNDAIWSINTNEGALTEIIFSRTNAELNAIKRAYGTLYKEPLEHAVTLITSGYFQRILVACLTGARPEGYTVDQARAQVDAQALYKAGPKRWGTDESTFISIFASRSLAHLKVTFDEYKRLANTDIENTIKSEMSGELEDAFLCLARIVKNKHAYFAQRLYKSMEGAGTKDNQLIRVVVTRSEKDLGSIKREFQQMYGKSLESYIVSDCSGDYKKILLAIVNGGIVR